MDRPKKAEIQFMINCLQVFPYRKDYFLFLSHPLMPQEELEMNVYKGHN